MRDVCNLAINNSDTFPATSEVAKRYLLAPVSTVDCERGFSRQNLVKTDIRNRMSVETLENILRISIDGPAECNVDSAFKIWAKQKTRRILK